jgi:hypothetical protein
LHPGSAQSQSCKPGHHVDARYNQSAVDFFVAAFDLALHRSLEEQPDPPAGPLLREQFAAVRLFDSTQFVLPASLAERFPACGGGGGQAGLKVLLAYEYLLSQFQPLAVLPAKRSDQGLAGLVGACVGPQELGLFDKGFFNGPVLRAIHERRLLPGRARSPSGKPPRAAAASVSFSACVWGESELTDIRLGQGASACDVRLLAYRLSVESASGAAPPSGEMLTYGRLPTAEALELAGWVTLVAMPGREIAGRRGHYLYRCGESTIFKQLKSVLRIDEVPTGKEHRFQEVWARLLAGLMLFSWHRYTNAACWAEHHCEISSPSWRAASARGSGLARAIFAGGFHLQSILSRLWISSQIGSQRGPAFATDHLAKICTHWLERPTARIRSFRNPAPRRARHHS